MSLLKHKQSLIKLLRESIMMIIGAILIWRGVWILLDLFDNRFFGGVHIWSAMGGIAIGAGIVYLADRDLEDVV
jgi:hypothetical protein